MTSSWWDEPLKIGKRTLEPSAFLQEAWLTLTDQEIAGALVEAGAKTNASNVSKKRQALRLRKTREGTPIIFEDGGTKRYNKPPILISDNVLVMADVHVPYHDAEWCSEVVRCAKASGITDCIIAGDLFDFAALSSFAKSITVEGDDGDVSEEVEAAADFVSVLLSSFERVVFTLGNHEKRLSRSTGVKIRTSLIRALLGQRFEKRLQIEPYYYSIIKSTSGAWRVTHPKNASVIPVRVAATLCNKFEMNVIAAHGHDWGEATSTSGRYAAATGCCGDVHKFDYVQLEDNTRPIMQQGAWMLARGAPVLLHPVYRKPSGG